MSNPGPASCASACTPTGHEKRAAAATAIASVFRESLAGNRLLDATVVTPAEPASAPVEPRPLLIIGAALILSLLVGLLLVIAIENLRRRVSTAADVAELTPAPVVGRIAREPALTGRQDLTAWNVSDGHVLKESYRAMRTNLELMLGGDVRCIQVTSPEEGQGKSVVVASLAIAFAQVGRDTVVVDADLRRPAQSRIFGLDNRSGLSTALSGSG